MDSDYCTVRFHYCGRFAGLSDSSDVIYVDGVEDDLKLDPDKISLPFLEGICQRGGFQNIKYMFYLKTGYTNLMEGMQIVESDETARAMANDMRQTDDLLHFYVDH
ncbi:hypothetical protein CCACVL1_00744 [Corchorus capsularis]|uniref:PB1-like domain-containing protein n=1 Tax=Corchorus capsularis TaxID=210143 RepID=A0A1R3KVA0_COCAP|nr:hypothetical protein CCACVL1_00744 [Corchorus capsularis]